MTGEEGAAHTQTISLSVLDRSHAHGPADIALDMRYADAVVGKGDNHSVADMRKISDVEANA